jgi:ankyrin repeat protein
MHIRELLFSGDLQGIDRALRENPSAANEFVALPDNPATSHPLHRICDAVFCGNYREEMGVKMAQIFFRHGADVNPGVKEGQDSPLTAACSLNCDLLALLYIDHGAKIDHRGCHGGTALHWAAWCGRDVIVKRIVEMNPDINQRCTDFKSTPLFWAIHGYRSSNHRHNQVECARILLAHGADRTIPNLEGLQAVELLEESDRELAIMLKN